MSSSFVGEDGTGTEATKTYWPDVDVPFGGKVEDKEWLERADHPLLNDVILDIVLEQVRRFDLKACRGVCKKWNERVVPHMHSIFQIKIHGNQSKKRKSESRRMMDFVNLFKSNELGIPFAKYQLGPFSNLAADGAGKQFLQICGDSIKEIVSYELDQMDSILTIENVSELLKFSPKLEDLALCGQFVSESRNIVKLFPDSTPVLSALKKLTVRHNTRYSPIKYCPTFFDELLGVALNVSHISIGDYDDYEENSRSGVIHVLTSIEKLGRESSIQSLTLNSVNFDDLQILKRMAEKPHGLKLKEINFHTDFDLQENKSLTIPTEIELAKLFKDTLEDFHVIDAPLDIYLMDFPKMPKLKSFKFHILSDTSDTVNKPVDLNHIFPVLETLNLDFQLQSYDTETHGDEYEPFAFFSEFQVCPTVKTLIVDDNPARIGTFRNILRVFPNLTKLTLCLGGKGMGNVLRRIWTKMTQLESLSLLANVRSNGVMTLDSHITGISIPRLKRIWNIIPYLEEVTVQDRREKILSLVEQHWTGEPSIRHLTNLKHLKLALAVGLKPIYNVSDLTGYLGICLMKQLKTLDMQHCEFTETCCEILTKETGLEAWSFQTDESGGIGTQHIIPPFQIHDGETD